MCNYHEHKRSLFRDNQTIILLRRMLANGRRLLRQISKQFSWIFDKNKIRPLNSSRTSSSKKVIKILSPNSSKDLLLIKFSNKKNSYQKRQIIRRRLLKSSRNKSISCCIRKSRQRESKKSRVNYTDDRRRNKEKKKRQKHLSHEPRMILCLHQRSLRRLSDNELWKEQK